MVQNMKEKSDFDAINLRGTAIDAGRESGHLLAQETRQFDKNSWNSREISPLDRYRSCTVTIRFHQDFTKFRAIVGQKNM